MFANQAANSRTPGAVAAMFVQTGDIVYRCAGTWLTLYHGWQPSTGELPCHGWRPPECPNDTNLCYWRAPHRPTSASYADGLASARQQRTSGWLALPKAVPPRWAIVPVAHSTVPTAPPLNWSRP